MTESKKAYVKVKTNFTNTNHYLLSVILLTNLFNYKIPSGVMKPIVNLPVV